MKQLTPDKLTPELILLTRERLNLSQELMAKRLNCYQKSISHWETGKRRPSRLYRILLTDMANKVLEPEELRPDGA